MRTVLHPELAAIVGATVPDYRGHFLRHVGGLSAALGVAQGDAIRNITVGTGWTEGDISVITGAFKSLRRNRDEAWPAPCTKNWETLLPKFDASLVVPTAMENRPANVAVKWLIFAGN